MSKSFFSSLQNLILNNSWFQMAILLGLIFGTRYGLLFSPEAVLNGDECVLGLMAKHFMEGEGLPLFFYGQAYGFSFIETFFVALAFKINGISALSLNMGILALWTIGILFLYQLLSSLSSKPKAKHLAFVVSAILVLSPSWLNFSMQARGGYVTAFSLSFMILYLLKNHQSILNAGLCGLLTVLVFESQPLWIPPLVPLLILFFWKYQKRKQVLAYVFSLLIAVVGFHFLKAGLLNFWRPPVFKLDFDIFLGNLSSFWDYLQINLSGLYYLQVAKQSPFIIQLFGILFSALVILACLFLLWRIFSEKPNYGIDILYLLSVVASIAPIFVVNHFAARYLLAFSCFAVLVLFYFLLKLPVKPKDIILLLMLAIGLKTIPEYADAFYPEMEKAEIEELLAELDKQVTSHVFTTGPLLQWQLMFYSKEEVMCRFKSETDRYPSYVEEVNDALQNGLPTALISKSDRLKAGEPDWTSTSGNFVIIYNPSKEELQNNKFRF